MALNYVNGIQLGGVGGASPWAYGARQMRRWLRLWLTKVVGWGDHDASGANWDNPDLSVLTDGATDAANPRRFTSATGGFTTAMEGSFLLIRPTAAPATAGGFADAKRNGFYQIARVYDGNTLDVIIWNGVHTDGLPLSETGLTFEIHNFRPSSLLPADGDYYVVRGQGIGGDFDVRFREDYGSNYGPTRVQASPWADWDNVGHAWSPGTRVTTEETQVHQPYGDLAWVWAIADLTHVIVWARMFEDDFSAEDSSFLYIGDLTAFHPIQDPRPVVVVNNVLGASLDEISALGTGIRMVGSDDTTPVSARVVYLSSQANNSRSWHSEQREDRSRWSGRFARSPLLVYCNTAGHVELRGQFKSLDHGHYHGPRGPVPFGTSLDRLRFFTQCNIPWNGSRVNRYVY